MNKKLFRLNEDGVAEWIVSENKNQAISYAATIWGIDCVLEYFQDFLRDNPDGKISEFIDGFVKEETLDKIFTLHHEDGRKETKTIGEFIKNITEVPSYLACQDY